MIWEHPKSPDMTLWPSINTTAPGLLAYNEVFFAQHPKLRWTGTAHADEGTSGDVQLVLTNDDGDVRTAPIGATSGDSVRFDHVLDVPPFTQWRVEVWGRVTSGPGSIRCATWGLVPIG